MICLIRKRIDHLLGSKAMISLWQYGEARDKVEVYEWILVLGALGMVLGTLISTSLLFVG